MDPKPAQQKQKIARRRKRPVGRPPKGDECVKGRRGSRRTQRKALGSWSDRTKAYIKMVTGGKGAPCKIWSVVEKRQLLEGLKKYSHQDWDSLCKKVPTRTKEEIQEYIHQLKGGVQCKRKGNQDAQLTWAPIESWLDMSTEMIHYEQEDLSNILSRVFSIIGSFSRFPECTSPALEPDYGKLYRYIAAVMDESLSMPTLTPLESAIIADLMHGLGDRLRMSDTSLQRKVMCWKYKMLNHKFDFDDVRASLDRIRRALTNDFSDLQRGGNQSVSRLSSFGQTSTTTITQATTSEASDGHPGTSVSASPAVGPPSSQPPSRQSEADKDTTNQILSSESDKDATNQTSSSENDKDATNQTPSSESGAAGLAASQNSESAVSTSGDASLNPSRQDSSRTAETSEAELAGDECGGPTKRKPGRQRVHDWRRPIEKPRLYSMNPFCVPIRLLRLKPLLAATPSAAVTTTSTTGRRQSVSSSQSEASTSSYLWQKRLKNTKEAANQELEWNSIRQVTGLYKPTVPSSRKKKEAMHKTLLPAKMQVSSATMDAMKAALALRSKHKAVVESSTKPAGAVTPAKTAPYSPVITLPGGQRVVQVTSKASSASTVPTHAFRCIELPDGKMALVPVTVTKLGSGLNPAPSASEGNTPMPQPREQQRTPQAAPATSPSVSGIPSPFQSPLRAPLAGCSVSVGTSDENSQEVPTTIASRVRGSSLSVGKPQASAKLSAERTPQGRTADDKGVSEGSRGRSASTAGRKVVAKSGSGPKVTKQTDASAQQSRPVSSSSCQSDTTEQRATQPQPLERSATQPQPAKEGAKQSQPVQQRTAQPQLVEHRAAQPQPVEQKHAQSQPVEQRTTPIAEQRTAPSQPVAEQKTAPSQQVVEQKTAQSQPVEQKLVHPQPAEQRAAQLQPTEQRPAQPQPLEQRAVLSQAVELRATQSQPAKQRPAQPPPAEQRPAHPPPAEQRPAQPPPAEQRPAHPPPAEQRPAQPPPAEQRPAQPPPAEQRPAQPPPAEQRPAQQQPPEKRTTAQSRPAKQSSPSVIQSASSENITGTQKQSSSGKSVVRRCSADGFQTEGIISLDTTGTVRPGSGDLLGQRTVARSVSLNHLEVTSSEPRTATQSCSVDQPKAVVCSAGPHPRPRTVVRSVSCKSAPSRQSGQAVVIKTLSRSHFSRGSAADWSVNPDSEARQSTSENVQSSSSDDGSPSLRLTRPVKTYTRMPSNKAMGEKSRLLSFKDGASAQSGKNSQRVLQPISRTPKMSQQREVGQKPPCIIYVSPKTPLATDAGQEKTPPSSTKWKKGPPSTKKPGSTKTRQPAKTPSSDTGQKTPQSAAVGKKTTQIESPSTSLRTAQSSTSQKTAQPATSQKTTQSVTGQKTTLSAASQKTAPPATGQKSAPPATGQKSAPPAAGQKSAPPAAGQKTAPPATGQKSASPATGQKSAPPAAGQKTAPPATCQKSAPPAAGQKSAPPAAGQKSAPPATGQKSAPPTMSLNKGVKSSFKTILAQVASPHVTPSKRKPAPTPGQPNAETASPGGSPQNCSVAASPSGTRPSRSSSVSPTSTPSPAKKLKLAKKFLVKQEPAGAAQTHSTTPAGEGKQKSQASYPKAKKRPANYLAEQDISNMQVEYVTVDAAKKRMRIPAGRPQKAYEAERQQRMGSALKLGRPTLQMRLDDEEISLVSI